MKFPRAWLFWCSSRFVVRPTSSFATPALSPGPKLTAKLNHHSARYQQTVYYKRHHRFTVLLDMKGHDEYRRARLAIFQDYVSLLRPVTLIQAVGAWVVGRLAVLQGSNGGHREIASAVIDNLSSEVWAILVVLLSYGVGMVANDCADFLVDRQASLSGSSSPKSKRAIASGRISLKKGWMYVTSLLVLSLLLAFGRVSTGFGIWCTCNMVLMVLYALGLQKLLLVKNILVGWLCISPLWGATTLVTPLSAPAGDNLVAAQAILKLRMFILAMTGFSVGVIREILKDVEDIELDRGTKLTLPLVIGAKAARKCSFAALGATLVVLQSSLYRRLFASSLPLYSSGWVVATIMFIRACRAPTVQDQQSSVKRIVYLLLLTLIASMIARGE